MDGLKVAWRGVIASHKFFFWSVVGWITQAIYWHKVAAQEQLILKPRRPKDLYDAGYVLFAYDLTVDAWRGYWRTPQHTHGMAPAEVFEIAGRLWENVPFHEVEFSDMPAISFKVRAVALEWCRKECKRASEVEMPETAYPIDHAAAKRHAEEMVRAAESELAAQEVSQAVKH